MPSGRSGRRLGEPTIDHPFGEDHPRNSVPNDGYAIIERREQRRIDVDIDDGHCHAVATSCRGDGLQRYVTERTVVSGDELDAGCGHVVTIFAPAMRPFTAFVVVGLMVIIVVAFVIKMTTWLP